MTDKSSCNLWPIFWIVMFFLAVFDAEIRYALTDGNTIIKAKEKQ